MNVAGIVIGAITGLIIPAWLIQGAIAVRRQARRDEAQDAWYWDAVGRSGDLLERDPYRT